jgi:hypothetical protein
MRSYSFSSLFAILAFTILAFTCLQAAFAQDVIIDLPELPPLDKELIYTPPQPVLPPITARFTLQKTHDTQPNHQGQITLFIEFSRALTQPATLLLDSEQAKLNSEKTITLQEGLNSLSLPLQFTGIEGATVQVQFGSQQETLTLPIKNCTEKFTSRLNGLEISHRAPLYAAYLEVKKPSGTPLISPFFTPTGNFSSSKDGKEAVRLYGLLRNRNGADPIFLTTNILGDSLNRSLGELKGFLTQKTTAGICAGLPEFLSFYKTRLKEFEMRATLYDKSIAFGLARYNLAKKPEESELTQETLANSFTPPLSPLLAFLQTLHQGQARFKTMQDKTTGFFGAIASAHQEECSCAD